MENKKSFTTKEDGAMTVAFSREEIDEIVPDADMRYSLVILKNGDKHFVCGTVDDVNQKFAG